MSAAEQTGPGDLAGRYGIWLILALALILRVFRLDEMALSNDELSALARCRYDSLKDLLRFGVVEKDMHPPLVQVFVYYYTRLFGDHPLVYKLPFVACGMGSVYVAFRLFSLLVNRQTALLVAAFMATSQYFITHAQTARMYAPALLLTLLFTERLFRPGEKAAWRTHAEGGLWLLLVANTHYMALVTCAIAGVLYLLMYGEKRRGWMITFLVCGSLFALEMPLLLPQFRQGGPGWIGVPQWRYLYDYLDYLVQFNPLMLAALLTGSACSCVLLFRSSPGSSGTGAVKRNLVFGLLLFLASYAFAFFYSRLRAPIIQYSVLLFAACFLLAFACYPLSLLRGRWFVPLLAGIMLLNTWGLVFVRKHYRVYYRQGYHASAEMIVQHASGSTPLFLNALGEYYYTYYFKRYGFGAHIINARIDSLTFPQFRNMISETGSDTIAISHGFVLPYEYVSVAKELYPQELFAGHDVLSDTYVLAKGSEEPSLKPVQDTFDAAREFGTVSTLDFTATHSVMNLVSDARVMPGEAGANPGLVVRITDEAGKEVAWREVKYRSFAGEGAQSATMHQNLVVYLEKGKTYRATAVVWNNGRQAFRASQPALLMEKGNQNLFGTLMPLNRD